MLCGWKVNRRSDVALASVTDSVVYPPGAQLPRKGRFESTSPILHWSTTASLSHVYARATCNVARQNVARTSNMMPGSVIPGNKLLVRATCCQYLGNIITGQYCFYSPADFSVFAPLGRHVAPIEVKFDREERISFQFRLDRLGGGVYGPQEL